MITLPVFLVAAFVVLLGIAILARQHIKGEFGGPLDTDKDWNVRR